MNKKLRVLLLSNSIFVFAGSLFVPIYALFTKQLGADPIISGLLYAVHFISSTIVVHWISKQKDKVFPLQEMLATNYFIRGFSWLLVAFFPNLYVLFITQALVGLTEGIGNASFNTLISENLDTGRHISEWATWDLWKNPLIALSAILGGFIVTAYGFDMLFFVMAALSFTAFFVYKLKSSK